MHRLASNVGIVHFGTDSLAHCRKVGSEVREVSCPRPPTWPGSQAIDKRCDKMHYNETKILMRLECG
jgi:hypothetical protein